MRMILVCGILRSGAELYGFNAFKHQAYSERIKKKMLLTSEVHERLLPLVPTWFSSQT